MIEGAGGVEVPKALFYYETNLIIKMLSGIIRCPYQPNSTFR